MVILIFMGIYINKKSRKSQIKKAEQKMHQCSAKIGQCFGKLLDNSSKKKDEVEITRLFLEGVMGYIHYSSIKREMITESAKLDLTAFIEKEMARIKNQSKN